MEVGSTGYIIWPEENDLPTFGYTLDEIGRTVGVVGGIRFFQRYTGNCMLVSDMGKEDGFFTCLTEDDEDVLRTKLNAYQRL